MVVFAPKVEIGEGDIRDYSISDSLSNVAEIISENTLETAIRINELLHEQHFPKGTIVDLQFALRAGYVIEEFAGDILRSEIERAGYNVKKSVLGISGSRIYAQPESPTPGSVTIVLDSTAGTSSTLKGASDWHWGNRVEISRDIELPEGWNFKHATKYFVGAVSITRQTIQELESCSCNIAPISPIIVDRSIYENTEDHIRLFSDKDCVKGVRDLGDLLYGNARNYTSEDIQKLVSNFRYMTPAQKEQFINFYTTRYNIH